MHVYAIHTVETAMFSTEECTNELPGTPSCNHYAKVTVNIAHVCLV